MAWLEQHPTAGHFKICFRWAGRKLKKTVKTTSQEDAETALARFRENLHLLERGRLESPAGADVGTFLLSDGKLTGKPAGATRPHILRLGELRDLYVGVHANGAMEENPLDTVRMHLRHLLTTLGSSFAVASLTPADLQRHIDRRARKRYRDCWNWAVQAGHLDKTFPARGLKYPKTDENPPFQTRAVIERQIARWIVRRRGASALGRVVPDAAGDRATAPAHSRLPRSAVPLPDGVPGRSYRCPAE
jgi:hypothetical protein